MKKLNKIQVRKMKGIFLLTGLAVAWYCILLITGGGFRLKEIKVGAVSEVKLPDPDTVTHKKQSEKLKNGKDDE